MHEKVIVFIELSLQYRGGICAAKRGKPVYKKTNMYRVIDDEQMRAMMPAASFIFYKYYTNSPSAYLLLNSFLFSLPTLVLGISLTAIY